MKKFIARTLIYGSLALMIAVNAVAAQSEDQSPQSADSTNPGIENTSTTPEDSSTETASNTSSTSDTSAISDQMSKPPVSVFKRDDCVHCQEELKFLNELKAEQNDFEIILHDINEPEEHKLWTQIAELEKTSKVTPITLVGNTLITGFDKAETTGQTIKKLIAESQGKETMTAMEYLEAGGSGNVLSVQGGTCDESGNEPCEIGESPYKYIPFLGEVNVKTYSLVALSAILGFVDGFNPCAMWVLITFLVILIDAGSRKKMWQLAGIFILAEAIMYYLILNVWFSAWDFFKLNNIITPIVGIVAVAAGLFFLYEWKTSDGTCKVTSSKQRAKISQRIKKLANMEITFLSIFAIIGLAFSVNIIEFACSIGIPQTFTKIIQLNQLDTITTQFYMAIYILMYMIDDFIVFGIALYGFEKFGVTTKYTKISHLIGGALMLILGAILLIDPELLVL